MIAADHRNRGYVTIALFGWPASRLAGAVILIFKANQSRDTERGTRLVRATHLRVEP